jgi:hypothetical protein
VLDTKPVGRDNDEVESDGMLKPHRPQNFEFCGTGELAGMGMNPDFHPG